MSSKSYPGYKGDGVKKFALLLTQFHDDYPRGQDTWLYLDRDTSCDHEDAENKADCVPIDVEIVLPLSY